MSDWVVNLPMRHRSEPINADALSDLPSALRKGPERDMARQLLLESRLAGMSTVGEVADWLNDLDGPGRRRVLDRLRGHVGLASTGEVEAQRRFEHANAGARLAAAAESGWQICHADGCAQVPINESHRGSDHHVRAALVLPRASRPGPAGRPAAAPDAHTPRTQRGACGVRPGRGGPGGGR
jgi:hypothetical protein